MMTDDQYNEELFKTFEKSLEDMKLAIEKYKTDADKRVNKIIELCDISPPPMVKKNVQWCGRCRSQHEMPQCEFIALPRSEGGHIPDMLYYPKVHV